MENIPQNADYEFMNESEMCENPVAKEVLQRKALEYLKTQDKEWFDKNYTGELDADGYLISKRGEAYSNTRPMQNIGGDGFLWVIQETKRELLNDPDFIQPPKGKGL